MARRGLGSTKAQHRVGAIEAEKAAQQSLRKAADALKRGNCHGAFSHILEAKDADGQFMAHDRAADGGTYRTFSSWRDVLGKFNDVCLVPERVDVGPHWSPALGRRGRTRARRRTR